ncbi:MAG: SDR family oxidoreductase [Verrucomicrobia bacterium]|nr:SDR family oxidoreductase [Verrucomicrobiota bacterium]
MDLRGKKILLTGAVGGLGWDSALEFVRAGGRVFALDINLDKGKLLEQQAADSGAGSLVYVNQDLGDQDGLLRTLQSIVQREGEIEILVNNAAIYPSKRFEEYSMDEYRMVQQINVEAAVICCQVLLAGMKQCGYGRIINVSSVTFYGVLPNLYPYVASKASLIGLTRAWAREFGAFGITVNAICPGAIPTEAEKIHPDPEAYTRSVLEHQALKRRGHPRDIAAALLYFASASSSFITGQVLNVDGGWIMH